MPKKKQVPYTCPRCDYKTDRRCDMVYHLYKLQRICPGVAHRIELTDDIKACVIENRIYHIQDDVKIMNQTINTYNTMNNFISNMDCVDKITKLASYKQLEIVDFETKVEDEYKRTVKKLEKDSFKYGFSLKHQDFMQIIDTLTNALKGDKRDEFIEHLNFIYDSKRKRIRVFNSAEKWEDFLVSSGINYLIGTIAGSYLESYEVYLIRKLNAPVNVCQLAEQQKCLEDYYLFLACFDVDPFVKGKYDAQILFNKDAPEYDLVPESSDVEAHQIVDRFTKTYVRIFDSITNAQRRIAQKEVLDIIKSNTQNTVNEIDKDILNMINIDEGFKLQIMA
jgi:hypothetical protein